MRVFSLLVTTPPGSLLRTEMLALQKSLLNSPDTPSVILFASTQNGSEAYTPMAGHMFAGETLIRNICRLMQGKPIVAALERGISGDEVLLALGAPGCVACPE